MVRLGVLDFNTSHVVEFTKRLLGVDCPADQHVPGAKVVVGCPGESKISPERIAGYADQMKKYGVPLVDKPADMIGKIDAVLVQSVDGSVHWERARPFLEAGVPCFIDKPLACSTDDAKRLADLAAKKKVLLFGSSSLRYATEVVDYVVGAKQGKILGCVTFGPGSTHPRNPGLFHYGVHAVEMMFTLMGRGCERVTCTTQAGADVATGTWKDGRVATVRANRVGGGGGFGFTAYAEKGSHAVPVGTSTIYRELLKKIVAAFETGKSPVEIAESVEIVAFMEAANASGANHGAGVTLKA